MKKFLLRVYNMLKIGSPKNKQKVGQNEEIAATATEKKNSSVEKPRKNTKKILLCVTAFILLCVVIIIPLSRCAGSSGKAMLTLKADGKTYSISVNLYELMCSAMKGTLMAYNYTLEGHRPSQDAYWNIMDAYDGKTMETSDSYYRKSVLENCKTYLVSLYLFDKYDLELSESAKKEIEDTMDELVKTDGEGSKAKLNSVLANYGVNYKMLKEYYTIKAKFQAVQDHIYSTTGPNVKGNYLNENYVHFYQIFLANYTYVYETDKNGDTIYYNASTNQILYKETEFTQTTSSGKVETDSKGNIIYYTDVTRTHISYDKEKGQPSYKIAADNESYETKPMTEEELDALVERANDLHQSLQGVTKDVFVAKVSTESDDTQAAIYTDGYYLQKGVDFSASGEDYMYLDTIVEKLSSADVKDGDVIMIPSPSGYHILFKCAPTDKAYELEANTVWFSNFASGLTAELFADQAEPYLEQIKLNEKVYAKAPSMKEVAINYFYY